MQAVIPISPSEYATETMAPLSTRDNDGVFPMNVRHVAVNNTDRRSRTAPNLNILKLPSFESASHPANRVNARNGTTGSIAR